MWAGDVPLKPLGNEPLFTACHQFLLPDSLLVTLANLQISPGAMWPPCGCDATLAFKISIRTLLPVLLGLCTAGPLLDSLLGCACGA